MSDRFDDMVVEWLDDEDTTTTQPEENQPDASDFTGRVGSETP